MQSGFSTLSSVADLARGVPRGLRREIAHPTSEPFPILQTR